MCGILLAEGDTVDEEIVELVRSRGSEFYNRAYINGITTICSVLCTRGYVPQPVTDENYVFLYNGEDVMVVHL